MQTEKRYVPYCRLCQRPLEGKLGVFRNADDTWSLDLEEMTCEGTKALYATFKEEFSLETITKEQDDAFDSFTMSHLLAWTVMETLHVDDTDEPRIKMRITG